MSRARASLALQPAAPRSRAQLSWTDSSGAHILDLAENRTCGSAVHCELVIADRAVSRIHFELSPEADGLWIRDLGSRNGTYVGGVKVTEGRIPAGAVIRVGSTDITVNYSAPEPPGDLWTEPSFGGLTGYSAPMRELFANVAHIAGTDANVILEGEPGTGKKALARALHDASPRAGQPFVVVECASIFDPLAAADILEDALAGAEGGTLVLEEPNDLSLAVQRELTPPIDAKAFRIIVTTAKDLRRMVNQGSFRESLYFRLAEATLRVPPIRDRGVDLIALFEEFLGDDAGLLTEELLVDLQRLPWAGNVRELKLYAERLRSGESGRAMAAATIAALEHEGKRPPTFETEYPTMEVPIVALEDIHRDAAARANEASGPASAIPPPVGGERALPAAVEPWFEIGFKEFREKWIELGEREYLRRLMLRTGRASGAASREAGLERTYLYRLLKKHGV